MPGRGRRPPEGGRTRWRVARGLVVAATFAALGAGWTGCVEINGGAVEVPWTVFAADGRGAINDCSCADPAIAYVRLRLTAPDGSDPCATTDACRFECHRKTGATPFMIAAGTYLMSIEPEGADGAPLSPALVSVPAPMTRQVVRGAPTELDAFDIEVACAASCHGDDVDQPCAP
jgi:hypothetical protein